MSFEEQERALFDLLFDRTLRESFCKDSIAALSQYKLDEDERNDFIEIRPDALELDASIRTDLLLSHFCRAFPISFSIVSSFNGGLDILKELVDTQTMRTSPVERSTIYGGRLREVLTTFSFDTPDEQAKVSAILEAELGMVWTSASLKRGVLDKGMPSIKQSQSAQDWSSRLVKLAPYVCAAIIPGPYRELKSSFCSSSDCDLWRRLSKRPLSASRRRKILVNDVPRDCSSLVLTSAICHVVNRLLIRRRLSLAKVLHHYFSMLMAQAVWSRYWHSSNRSVRMSKCCKV